MHKRKKPFLPEVLLLIETSTNYGRGILEGIGRYVREHGPWLLYFQRRGLMEPPPEWLHKWQGDGIIARTTSNVLAKKLHATGLPVVDLLGERKTGPCKIHADNVAEGRLAAEHLLDCGLRHFGFFAFDESWAVDLLREGFCRTLAAQGFSCDVYQTSGQAHLCPRWQAPRESTVVAWLRRLPQTVGVYTLDPEHALCLLDICRAEGIAVPERVAILANGDDPVIYNAITPPLSGVDTNPSLVGYEAAALLDRLMAGQPPTKNVLLVPPARVVPRQSTDILAVSDAEVACAVRFIRKHACRGIDVAQVASAAGLSRRMLERRFQKHLGHPPKDEILRVCIEQAKTLLQQSDMAIEMIAGKCGAYTFKNFAMIFLLEVGMSPREFRCQRRKR